MMPPPFCTRYQRFFVNDSTRAANFLSNALCLCSFFNLHLSRTGMLPRNRLYAHSLIDRIRLTSNTLSNAFILVGVRVNNSLASSAHEVNAMTAVIRLITIYLLR